MYREPGRAEWQGESHRRRLPGTHSSAERAPPHLRHFRFPRTLVGETNNSMLLRCKQLESISNHLKLICCKFHLIQISDLKNEWEQLKVNQIKLLHDKWSIEWTIEVALSFFFP